MSAEIRQIDLARLAGVQPQPAHVAFHGELRDAQTPDGKRLYEKHPAVQRYIHTRHGNRRTGPSDYLQPTVPAPPSTRTKDPFAEALACATPPGEAGATVPAVSAPVASPALNPRRARTDQQLANLNADTGGALPRDLDDLGAMTLREVIDRFGTLEGLASAVKAMKQFAEFRHREIGTQQKRGELIERTFVDQTLLPLLDLAFSRLVGEAPSALREQIIARVMSGGEDLGIDVEGMIRKEISSILESSRDRFKREVEKL